GGGGEFLAALGKAAGRALEPLFTTFLDASGAPELHVALACDGGGARVHLAQQRYLPRGSKGQGEQTWKLPVCLRTAAGRTCLVLDEPERDVPLEGGKCPDWLVANADGAGYYLPICEGDRTGRLTAHFVKRTRAEQLAFLDDAHELMAGGRAPAGDLLALAARLGRAADPLLVKAAATVADLERLYVVGEAAQPA